MIVFIFFIVMSSFFLGGNIRKWMLDFKLDVWEKCGMVLHPLVIGVGIWNLLKMGPLAD